MPCSTPENKKPRYSLKKYPKTIKRTEGKTNQIGFKGDNSAIIITGNKTTPIDWLTMSVLLMYSPIVALVCVTKATILSEMNFNTYTEIITPIKKRYCMKPEASFKIAPNIWFNL